MYRDLYPVTHHFYPLQRHEDPSGACFAEFNETLRSPKEGYTENLIYLHIPYCQEKCIFCPFHVRVTRDEQIFERYVSALEREVALLGQLRRVREMRFKAVYFGGGSPSLLGIPHLTRLFDALRANFDIESDAEWTFEGEPNTLSQPNLLSFLAEQKTTRLSYGIQTFDRALRDKLLISATVEDAVACRDRAKSFGFQEVNVDMMFHLPGQTMEALEFDIAALESLDFESIDYYYMSYYGLPKRAILDMETGKFPRRPPEALRFDMGAHIHRRMSKAGYHHVTDHVFSKRPDGSAYYRLLWGGGHGEHAAETLAIGASARGYVGGYSYGNIREPIAYIDRVEKGIQPLFKVSGRLRNPRSRGMVFFPKFFVMPKSLIPDDGQTRGALQRLIDHELVGEDSQTIFLTEKGKDWIPNITMEFFEPEQREICEDWVHTLNSRSSNRVLL